jgi:hypothetical protein
VFFFSHHVRAVLYLPSLPDNGTYILITGQHTAKALSNIRATVLAKGFTQPSWLKQVSATILRESTNISTRELIAGRCQTISQNVRHSTFSNLVRIFCKEVSRNEANAGEMEHLERSVVWQLAYEKSAWMDDNEPGIEHDVCYNP